MNEIIKNGRIKKGYTQEQIARILDVPLRTYQYIEYEQHEPKVLLALRVCKLLEVDPFEAYLPEHQNNDSNK
ncbi:MAG: helix-turn-helix transcriptional regulator [Syntrophomonas sp.]